MALRRWPLSIVLSGGLTSVVSTLRALAGQASLSSPDSCLRSTDSTAQSAGDVARGSGLPVTARKAKIRRTFVFLAIQGRCNALRDCCSQLTPKGLRSWLERRIGFQGTPSPPPLALPSPRPCRTTQRRHAEPQSCGPIGQGQTCLELAESGGGHGHHVCLPVVGWAVRWLPLPENAPSSHLPTHSPGPRTFDVGPCSTYHLSLPGTAQKWIGLTVPPVGQDVPPQLVWGSAQMQSTFPRRRRWRPRWSL